MTISESTITGLIESDDELKAIMNKIGRVYLPSGLSNIELMVLAVYIRTRINSRVCNSTSYQDTKKIFNYLGGNFSEYSNILKEGSSSGALGFFDQVEEIDRKTHSVIVPVISGNQGYEVLQKILGKISGGRSRLIVAGTKFSSRMNFVEFLNEKKDINDVRLVDSYINSQTLLTFATMEKKPVKLRVITANITQNSDSFANDLKEFVKESGTDLEIRLSKDVHDRYIIFGSEVWSLGSSIKDLGNKDAIISQIESLRNSIIDLFEVRWLSSDPYQTD